MIIHLTFRLIKKILLYKSYFPESYTRSKSKLNNELDSAHLKSILT